MNWKTPYNHDTLAEAMRTAENFEVEVLDADGNGTGKYIHEPTKAQQQFRDEVNINKILKDFGVTGQLPIVPIPPMLADFDEAMDFQDCMNVIAEAKHSFMMLPAEVRDAFNNDPHRYVNQVDTWLNEPDPKLREHHMTTLRALGMVVEPGPKADRTTLGDVLAAIKAANQGTPEVSTPEATKAAPGAAPDSP